MLNALALGLLLAVVLARRGNPHWRRLAAAAAAFAAALVFHRADRPLCTLLPTGTHFLWHALNGLTAYLAGSVVLDATPVRQCAA